MPESSLGPGAGPGLGAAARDDTELLLAAAAPAGEIACRHFRTAIEVIDKPGDLGPVTAADLEIDRMLRARLSEARPDYGWLSEESDDGVARLAAERVFVVDPIDGTHGFLKGRPHFTIVAAVVAGGRPVCAVIYNPITEDMYAAVEHAGATRNDAPIHVGVSAGLEGARLLAPRDTYEDPHWRTPLPSSVSIENRASIAYRLALVAEGSFDGMVSLSSKYEWDVAAGDLIVHEAGGRVTSPSGELLAYNKVKPLLQGVVSAGPILHRQLLDRLQPVPTRPGRAD